MSNSTSVESRNKNSTQESQYFDLHTRGCGYLSRVRWVSTTTRGRKSDPFLCCAISALHGDVASPSYTYFDLRVTGEDAQALIASLDQYVSQKKKVFVAFSIGDIYAHPYERNIVDSDTKKVTGKEWTALIKGRLLQVTHVKVDDVVIYSASGNLAADIDPTSGNNGERYEDNEESHEFDDVEL